MATTMHADGSVRKSTASAWAVTSVQLAYVGWFGVCVWVALVRAAHFAGHYYIPYQGDPYTANADVFTGWSRWFYTPMTMTAGLQPLMPIMVLGSIGVTAWQLTQPSTRRNRVLLSLLVASTLLVVATFILANTTAGESVSNWILD